MSIACKAITDATPVRAGELAAFMRIGRSTVYQDIGAGYVFEFATHKLTTPGHYKEWLRSRARETKPDREDSERLRREQDRLSSIVGKSDAPRSKRGSRTPSLPRAKSSGSLPRA